MSTSTPANAIPDGDAQSSLHRSANRKTARRVPSRAAHLLRGNSELATYYQTMLNNLGWQPGCLEPKLIALTGCSAGEGVSTVATQLAICASCLPANVLLIDGNQHHPSLHLPFRIRSSIGFSEFLQSGNTLDSVHDTGVPNLSIMPFGTGSLAPLAATDFESAMESVLAEFDLVILDLPPISAGPQTVGWAAAFKHLLLVVSQSTTTREATNNKRILEKAGAQLAGIVQILN